MDLYIYIIGIIVCVMLSAFFSASEMSYSACNKVRLEHERDNGNKPQRSQVSLTMLSPLFW